MGLYNFVGQEFIQTIYRGGCYQDSSRVCKTMFCLLMPCGKKYTYEYNTDSFDFTLATRRSDDMKLHLVDSSMRVNQRVLKCLEEVIFIWKSKPFPDFYHKEVLQGLEIYREHLKPQGI